MVFQRDETIRSLNEKLAEGASSKSIKTIIPGKGYELVDEMKARLEKAEAEKQELKKDLLSA